MRRPEIGRQIKSRKFFDPQIPAFAPPKWHRPLLWVTTQIYGIIAIGGIYAGLNLLTGK